MKAEATYDSRAGCFCTSAIGELRTSPKGKQYRLKVWFRDLTHPTRDWAAAQARLHAELEKQAAAMRAAGDLSFEHLSELYLEAIEPRVQPETYDRANEHLERFGGWPDPGHPNRMDRRSVRAITRSDLEGFRDAMLAAGNSESYVAEGLLKTLRALFRWAHQHDAGKVVGLPIPANPTVGLKSPAVPRRRPRAIDPTAVSRFLRWAWRRALTMGDGPNGRHAQSAVVLLMTLRDTGARPKDLCVAEWSDWEPRSDGWAIVRLPAWKWKNGTKTGEERLIAIPPHCARRIAGIRALAGHHPTRIFTHRRGRGQAAKGIGTAEAGEPWVKLDHARKRKGDTKALQKWFNRLRKEAEAAGYPLPAGFRLYFNRSAYTTAARRAGVNDAQLARALGTSVRMLDRSYTDLDESDVLAVAMAALPRASA